MKAVVTGGAGFIGSHLVDALIGQGFTVHAIDNLVGGNKTYVHPSAQLHVVDIRTEACEQVILDEKPDVVFHLAAQVDVQTSIRNTQYDADVNICGTLRLLKACSQAGVRKFIFASTSAVYGDKQKERVSERALTAPISYYGLSKLASEHYIALHGQLNKLPYTILRFSNVFGPRQTSKGEGGVVAIFMDKLKQGDSLLVHGDGQQTRDFIYVQDVVQALLRAIEHADGEIVNVSTGLRSSINNLIEVIKVIHGDQIPVQYGSERVGDIKHSCLNNAKAERVLYWSPKVSLFEGLMSTYDSYIL